VDFASEKLAYFVTRQVSDCRYEKTKKRESYEFFGRFFPEASGILIIFCCHETCMAFDYGVAFAPEKLDYFELFAHFARTITALTKVNLKTDNSDFFLINNGSDLYSSKIGLPQNIKTIQVYRTIFRYNRLSNIFANDCAPFWLKFSCNFIINKNF
jgi:hypothetical protein